MYVRIIEKTPTEDMVDVKTKFLQHIMKINGINQSELSVKMKYNPQYISTSISDGRLPKAILMALSYYLKFPYEDAVEKKTKDTKKDKK